MLLFIVYKVLVKIWQGKLLALCRVTSNTLSNVINPPKAVNLFKNTSVFTASLLNNLVNIFNLSYKRLYKEIITNKRLKDFNLEPATYIDYIN